ncbi:lysoplasmalogenase [Pontimicrobium aquaticum]|uniref:Lysoplasmalogenase n=1 Tax=Pontimicrobium aquaticum TaxID=2565367 RepID=A0A4U0EWJ5_9FLAO|nr:lysoplasmalogenase [Pontimicrobium aquaticum]TJY36220.1 lysoplasmalogenase [Pontimicrobium aquaticum]
MQLTKTEKIFTLIFLTITLLELFSESIFGLFSVRFSPKPLILLSLIIFFIKQSKHLDLKMRVYMLLALLFSFNGDVLLMFVETSPSYFMFGLVAFLIAHLMYIRVFLNKRNKTKSILVISAILLIYALGMFYFLKDGLNDMLIPVALYMIIILLMTVSAWLRKGLVPKLSHTLVFIGAILFVISDSALALNKFYKPLVQSHIIIMSTYALAQYFIVMGILRQKTL